MNFTQHQVFGTVVGDWQRIDNVKKIVLLNIDIIFNFGSNCGIVGIFVV